MVGIVALGGYVPRYRLNRKLVFEAMGWFNAATAAAARGEKAVANHDEDSITMAVAACRDAFGGQSPTGVQALYLASTTLPYAERQNAAVAAGALDLPDEVRALDVGGTTRAGSSALLAALDAVAAGTAETALVAASDCRQGKMGGKTEHQLGDGAAAFLVGKQDVAARLLGAHSLTADFVDQRRPSRDLFGRSWEERWIRDEGHTALLTRAASECLQRLDQDPAGVQRLVVAGPDARTAAALTKKLGLPPERLQDGLQGAVGDAGAAAGPLALAAALEQAGPGERILLLVYGSGADAMLFETTDAVSRIKRGRGVAGHLEDRLALGSYEKYAVFRRLVPLDVGIRGEAMAPTAMSVLWRERKTFLGLHGNVCKRCGTPQFPPQHVCVDPECGAVDELEPYRFADRRGKLFTYTADNLAFSYDPPAIYGLVDFEGGGRLFLDFTDCRQTELQVGMPVSLTFRRKYLDEQGGVHGYFWKGVPGVR